MGTPPVVSFCNRFCIRYTECNRFCICIIGLTSGQSKVTNLVTFRRRFLHPSNRFNMPMPISNSPVPSALPIGQLALHAMTGSKLPLPAVRSYIIAGARRTHQEATFTEEYYKPQYAPEPTILGNLRFALRYEPIELGILYEVLIALGRDALS